MTFTCPACGRPDVRPTALNELTCTNADCPQPTAANAHVEVSIVAVDADGQVKRLHLPRLIDAHVVMNEGRLWMTGVAAAVPAPDEPVDSATAAEDLLRERGYESADGQGQ